MRNVITTSILAVALLFTSFVIVDSAEAADPDPIAAYNESLEKLLSEHIKSSSCMKHAELHGFDALYNFCKQKKEKLFQEIILTIESLEKSRR